MLEQENKQKENKQKENKQKEKIKLEIKLEKKLEKKLEIEIIKNYAKNCDFKECNTWSEINDCFAELQRKNNALMRDLPQDSSWGTINDYDDYHENNNIIYSYNPSKYKKRDVVPDKHYDNYYYNNCD